MCTRFVQKHCCSIFLIFKVTLFAMVFLRKWHSLQGSAKWQCLIVTVGLGEGRWIYWGKLKTIVFSSTFVNNKNITIPALTLCMVFTVRSEAATGIRVVDKLVSISCSFCRGLQSGRKKEPVLTWRGTKMCCWVFFCGGVILKQASVETWTVSILPVLDVWTNRTHELNS